MYQFNHITAVTPSDKWSILLHYYLDAHSICNQLTRNMYSQAITREMLLNVRVSLCLSMPCYTICQSLLDVIPLTSACTANPEVHILKPMRLAIGQFTITTALCATWYVFGMTRASNKWNYMQTIMTATIHRNIPWVSSSSSRSACFLSHNSASVSRLSGCKSNSNHIRTAFINN